MATTKIRSSSIEDGQVSNADLSATIGVTGGQIADDAVTLAKMAGLVRGKIIVGDASGDPSALTVGGANTVLTSDGTDAAWAASAVGGKVLQALTFTYSTEESTTSTSLVDTSLTLSITPVSSSNKVLVLISVPVKTGRNTSITSSSYAQGFAGIKRVSTNIYTSYFFLDDSSGRTGASETLLIGWSASILDSPSATIATAYTFQIATVRADYTTYSCEGARTGSIILMEIAA